MKNIVPLVAAVLLGIIAVVLVMGYLGKVRKEARVEMEMKSVLVAQKEIPKGTTLTAEYLAAREYPAKYVGSRAITPGQAASILNSRTKINIAYGRPIFWSDIELASEMEAGLSALLERGTRAVTIPVSEISGVAGFLRPNDRVDVLFSFNTEIFTKNAQGRHADGLSFDNPEAIQAHLLKSLLKQNQGGNATAVLLENILILATGSGSAGKSFLGKQADNDDSYGSVTVRVTDAQAQLLIYCMSQGSLTLLLRNAKFPEEDTTPGMVTAATLAKFLEDNLNAPSQTKGQ